MKTQNPDIIQHMMYRQMLNQKTPVAPYKGIFDATVVDTSATNPTLPAGTCRVLVPNYANTQALGPVPYPGTVAPPNGTPCTVGFVNPQINTSTAIQVRVLALIGVGGGSTGISDLDGGFADSVYLLSQSLTAGSANTVYLPSQHITGGSA
jgi:hypothetical protein